MTEIRCGQCARKLGEGEYIILAIKCPRCGAMNQLSASRAEPERLKSVGQKRGIYDHSAIQSAR